MTIRLDSNLKNEFDKLCQKLGMSANTAVNIFINKMVRSRSIPFIVSASDSEPDIRQEAMDAFLRARQRAESGEREELSLEEINQEISEARKAGR